MSQTLDQKPPVAVGHVRLPATDVAAAARWLETVVFRRPEQPPVVGTTAPFDLMVDDIEAARRDYAAKGLGPSEISRGRIHDSFHLVGRDGHHFTVTSSHAGGRAV